MIKSVRDIQEAAFPEKAVEKPYQTIPAQRPAAGQRLARNCALAALLLLTVVSVRNERMPSGQTVLSAIQTLSGEGWDETLGKISFVSALVPDTVAVFGERAAGYTLYPPADGELTHAWNEDEPYLSYKAGDGAVRALGDGQVMSVTADKDGYALRIRQQDGLEALYYDMADVNVREGDTVQARACIGRPSGRNEAIVEVRRDGIPLDPAAFIQTP